MDHDYFSNYANRHPHRATVHFKPTFPVESQCPRHGQSTRRPPGRSSSCRLARSDRRLSPTKTSVAYPYQKFSVIIIPHLTYPYTRRTSSSEIARHFKTQKSNTKTDHHAKQPPRQSKNRQNFKQRNRTSPQQTITPSSHQDSRGTATINSN
jgi:hypothetical protein